MFGLLKEKCNVLCVSLSDARMRFFMEPVEPDEILPQSCREFRIPKNSQNSTLYYDCLWNNYKYESTTYHFQYVAESQDGTRYLYKYVFRVPYHWERGQIIFSILHILCNVYITFLNYMKLNN